MTIGTMIISQDIFEMTFTSDICPRVSVDGVLMDSAMTAAVLREAKYRPNVKELTLKSVAIDGTVGQAVDELFSNATYIWDKVELIHCTGRNSQVIKACVSHTKHFAFTGNVPIAHNPRYSLDAECAKAIKNALYEDGFLTFLSLKGTRLDRVSLQAFADGLEHSSTLETLHLSHCAMDSPDTRILASSLGSNQHLKALSMAHCKIGNASIAEESSNEFCRILEEIATHPTLEVLNIYGMHCTERAIGALSSLLRSTDSALWHLGLKNNVRHPEEKLMVTSLFEALDGNIALTYLQISGNNVDNHDMRFLAQVLARKNTSLKALNLSANAVGDEGMYAFAKHLPEMKGLRLLDLQRNPFTEASKLCMIDALKDNVELERLDLDGKFDETKAYYLSLNKGGRRLLKSNRFIPLGLWPIVFERANRLPLSRSRPLIHFDVIFRLLHGPVLFQSTQKRSRSNDSLAIETEKMAKKQKTRF